MTKLLERAFTEAGKLPEGEQDEIGQWLLAEVASERRWAEEFARSQGLLDELSEEALRDHRKGRSEDLDPERL